MFTRTITAETTDEQILAPIKRAKQALLDFVTEEIDGEYLKGDQMVQKAQAVQVAEAVAHVSMRYAQVVRDENVTNEKKMTFLIRLLTENPDDQWSGRKNDSKRAANDAVREWARDQFDAIERD